MRTARRILVALVFSSLLVTASAQAETPNPHVMTKSSWDGIKLGDSLVAVADSHGWQVGTCDTSTPYYVAGIPASYGVEVGRGTAPGKVGFIEVFGKHVKGPHGLRVGIKTSTVGGFLSKGTEHDLGDSAYGWAYWVIPVKHHFIYVRTGDDDGSGTRDRIWTFGLAASQKVAQSRGQTQGGCF